MNILKVFVIISVIFITLLSGVSKPKMHKHFILESPNFKLAGTLQNPADMQSVRLFKIGEAKTEISQVVSTLKQENHDDDTNTKIKTEKTTSVTYPAPKKRDYEANHVEILLNSESSRISNDNSNVISNAQAWADLEKTTHELNQRYKSNDVVVSKPKTRSHKKTRQDSSAYSNGLSCPICDMAHDYDSKYMDEIIAWNKWRSDVQNRIMDDSDLDGSYGTVFYFTFKVDKNGNISNINVICTDIGNKRAINELRHVISNLNGKPILKFPRNSRRNSINFRGGFMLGSISRYSSPSDYHDYEQIRIRY